MITLIGPGHGHMSVDDNAKEFILVHALGRERLLVLSCFPIRLKVRLLPVRTRFFFFCLSCLHTSHHTCFQQRPDLRPPQITSRRVSTVQ